MRAFLLSLFLVFSAALLSAQADDGCDPIPGLSTSFEGCPNTSTINTGCASGWFASAGNPVALSSFWTSLPQDGNRMVVLGVSDSLGTCLAESMFLDVSSLQPGVDYELSIWVNVPSAFTTCDLEFSIDYTTGVAVYTGGAGQGPCLPVSSTPLFSSPNFSTNGWQNLTLTFEAQAGLDQIHLVPAPNSSSGLCRILVDNVVISECNPCEDVDVDAFFRLDAEFLTPNLYAVTPTLYDLYDNIGGQHTWVVYRSEQPNGPYTYLNTYNNDDFTFYAYPGFYYTVLHRVETECGTACYGWNICEGCGGNFQSALCEFCGPIDCSVIDEPCTVFTPNGLDCWSGPWGTVLAWSTIPGATYQVEFSPGGRCCERYATFFPFIMTTTGNTITPPSFIGDCFSWRVRAVCDKSISDWSEWRCSNLRNCRIWEFRPGESNGDDISIEFSGLELDVSEPGAMISLMAVPNPSFNGSVELLFESSVQQSAELNIYGVDGREVYSARLSADQLASGRYQLDYSSIGLPAGTYVAWMTTASGQISTRLVVAR